MNRKSALAIALLAALLVCAGCHNNQSEPTNTPPTSQPIAASAGVPVNKYCPVNPKDPIDPKVTYMYNGKVYGFCCEDCIADFKKDPAKYAATAK
jgi:YHS domain-containing protein